jgi:hypothetical protein
MAVGSIISAARYNAIQAKAEIILGNGSDRFGYGQVPLLSSIISQSNLVRASHIQNLKTDLTKAYVHQTGSLPALSNVLTDEEITDAVYVEYETISNFIYNNRNDIFESTQGSVESKLTSVRSASNAWGGGLQPQSIYHEFKIIFSNADARRHFFNTGGEIRISTTLTNTSGAKSVDWAGMMSAVGIIKFSDSGTSASSGNTTAIGNFNLTSTYQTIFNKPGTGIYSSNDYSVKAKQNSSSEIQIKIEFFDGLSNNVDEPVVADITSSISQLRATGIYVETPSPLYQNVQTLI